MMNRLSIFFSSSVAFASAGCLWGSSSSHTGSSLLDVPPSMPTDETGRVLGPSHDVRTAYDLFQQGLRTSRNKPCLGKRSKFPEISGETTVPGSGSDFDIWLTYEEVDQKARNLGSALISRGLIEETFFEVPSSCEVSEMLSTVDSSVYPGGDVLSGISVESLYTNAKGGFTILGIMAENRVEWGITEQAVNDYSFTLVPLYSTLGEEGIQHILTETQMSVVIVSMKTLPAFLNAVDSLKENRYVRHVVVTAPEEDTRRTVEARGLTFSDFDELASLPADPKLLTPPNPQNIQTICYTSGTTGLPKGALISHEMLSSNVAALRLRTDLKFTSEDTILSYLPAAHIFERIVTIAALNSGAKVGYFSGSTQGIMDDVNTLKPTVFPSVPRLFNKVYSKLMRGGKEAGGIKSALFSHALSSKLETLRSSNGVRHPLYDYLVFSKVRELLGGNVRLLVTGSAPLGDEVFDTLSVALSAQMVEGYGMTETGAATVIIEHNVDGGKRMVPQKSVEMKFKPVPEMGYTGGEKGEIVFRGPGVFEGYFKNVAKTREAFDGEGWLLSGDIGDQTGILDRTKQMFKLSQGEYVSPEKVENVYKTASFIESLMLYGDSLKDFAVALVVPDWGAVKRWAQEEGVSFDVSSLTKNEDLKKVILREMEEIGKRSGLQSFERAKNIALLEKFDEESHLTPSFKLKRHVIKQDFIDWISQMYEQGMQVGGRPQ